MKLQTILWVGLGTAAAVFLGRAATSGLGSTQANARAIESDQGEERRVMRVSSCDKAPNGARCGTADEDEICYEGRCTRNVCGDSLAAGKEECDDGNEKSDDGCSATCSWEPLSTCPNGVVDEGEECDDGNLVDNDDCTVRCTSSRCGDGAAGPGEECDDGNIDDTDDCTAQCKRTSDDQKRFASLENFGGGGCASESGDTRGASDRSRSEPGSGDDNAASSSSRQGSSAPTVAQDKSKASGSAQPSGSTGAEGTGSGSGPSGAGGTSSGKGDHETSPDDAKRKQALVDECASCREKHCRDYLTVDVIAGCFDQVNTQEGAQPDAQFIPDCKAAYECSRRAQCQDEPWRCWCGANITPDECYEKGPKRDAPCYAEWWQATRTRDLELAAARFGNLAWPSGWAFRLLECETTFCKKQCDL